MAKISFVGFQEQVEIPEGFTLLEIEETLESTGDKDFLYTLISDAQEISRWLFTVVSFNSRPGGKMVFTNGSQATCTTFILGREVSLISEDFGNFTAKIVKGKRSNSLQLKFSILSNDVESKTVEIMEFIDRLQKLL